MNLNELAKEVSALEGGKKNLSIAQIKEVIRCIGVIFYYKIPAIEVDEVVLKMILSGERQVEKAKKKRK